jgi:pyruvate/2-oxoglutarate dehydrogenase complex dihydrolipoamide acyltransferase (E2) component
MAIYCFECGVEVSESQKILHNGRIYCSQNHAASTRQTAAPPQVKAATQPKPAQNPAKPAPAAQAAAAPKATTNAPAAPAKIPGKA